MKIHFLGTNGWYTTPTGNTPCILIDSKDRYVIFDAGNGFYKIDQYIKEDKPISLFISHFHLDHITGLQTLSRYNFAQGIDVYVGPDRKKDFDNFVGPPYTLDYKNKLDKSGVGYKTEIRVHELQIGKSEFDFPIEVFEMYHIFKDHGYKVTLEGKTVAYSGDTGTGPNNVLLAKDADVLIHESSYTKDIHVNYGHVNSSQAAQIAKEAGVKQLILTHFDASLFTTIEKRKEAEAEAKEIFPNTIAAVDDFVYEI